MGRKRNAITEAAPLALQALDLASKK